MGNASPNIFDAFGVFLTEQRFLPDANAVQFGYLNAIPLVSGRSVREVIEEFIKSLVVLVVIKGDNLIVT